MIMILTFGLNEKNRVEKATLSWKGSMLATQSLAAVRIVTTDWGYLQVWGLIILHLKKPSFIQSAGAV